MDEVTKIKYEKRCYVGIYNGNIVNGDEWNGEISPFRRIDNHEDGSQSVYYGLEFENEATYKLVLAMLQQEAEKSLG